MTTNEKHNRETIKGNTARLKSVWERYQELPYDDADRFTCQFFGALTVLAEHAPAKVHGAVVHAAEMAINSVMENHHFKLRAAGEISKGAATTTTTGACKAAR